MSGSHAEGVHVEVFVRSLAPRAAGRPQRDVVAALDRLTEQGTIGDYTITVCGKEVPADASDAVTPVGKRLVECVDTFERWAEHNDRQLVGVFDQKEVHSSLTGEEYVCRIAPVLGLAEYEGTDLRFVAPSADEGESVTVRDRLAELDRSAPATEAERLPDARDLESQTSLLLP